MKSIAPFVIFIAVLAWVAPKVLHDGSTDSGTSGNVNLAATSESSSGPKTARAFRDNRGHYSFNTRMNGTSVKALVDTGASAVAITQKTAKRIGAKLKNRTVRVSTANGVITASKAVIKEIKIGNVVVRNVDAFVLPDSALSGTLLGMSFLKRLKRFEFNDRTLTLVQR